MVPNSAMFRTRAMRISTALMLAALPAVLLSARDTVEPQPRGAQAARTSARFHVEEATIADVHRAIQQGDATCAAIVQAYIDRARAYNGACTQLVTRDGAPASAASGAVRAGAATSFPTATTAVGSIL